MSAPSGTLVGIVDDDPSVRKGLARVFALVVTGMLNKQVAAELGRVEKP
jgi:FixJ family two-component response regulator